MKRICKIAFAIIVFLIIAVYAFLYLAPIPSSWMSEWVKNNNVNRCETIISLRPQVSANIMHEACIYDRPHIVEMLLSKGAPIDENPTGGWPPLYRAAVQGSLQTVTLLLDKGANPNVRIDSGKTPLFGAEPFPEFKKYKMIIQSLLSHGASINAQDNQGDTVLHHWVPLGRAQAVQYFLQLGADPNIKNHSGKLPVDLLPETEAENFYAIRLMLQSGQHDFDLTRIYP